MPGTDSCLRDIQPEKASLHHPEMGTVGRRFLDIRREDGNAVRLSTPLSTLAVHKMRAEQKAILVGRRTALLDNPSLTVREWYGQNPLRLVIDRQLTLPPHLHLFDGSTPTLVFTEKKRPLPRTSLT